MKKAETGVAKRRRWGLRVLALVGALVALGRHGGDTTVNILASLAVAFAMINVTGGYLVTDRMLEMFKKKDNKEAGQ